MGQNNAWVESTGGDPQEHQHQPVGIEFPDLPGSDCVHKFHHGPVVGYSKTWDMLARAVRARAIEVLYETPGKEPIQHGVTKEILGIRAERDGKACYIEASRAVVLTCRGFENNQEMIAICGRKVQNLARESQNRWALDPSFHSQDHGSDYPSAPRGGTLYVAELFSRTTAMCLLSQRLPVVASIPTRYAGR
jgi:hypothetical protein